MKTVACVGIAVRDLIFSVESLPSGPGKVHAIHRQEVGGGPAANAAAAIARLGGSARFIGPLGDDSLGRELTDELAVLGVDLSRVRSVMGAKSPLSAVAVDSSGERSIVNHTDPRLFEHADSITAPDLANADAVLADVRWSEGAASALDWARRNGIPGIVDFDIGAASSEPLLAAATHVVFSAPALRQVSGLQDLIRALDAVSAMTRAWLAVTDGPRGSLWLENGEARHLDAFDVDAIDTTGAGDIYHGVFALSLAEGNTEVDAIERASAAAAISCTRFGGRAGAPDRDELERFLEEAT